MILTSAVTTLPLRLPKFNTTNCRKPIKSRVRCCSRDDGQINSLYVQPLDVGLDDGASAELAQASTSDSKLEQNEIWRLFKEAQHNILYLNKQRTMALEELKRVQKEKLALLDRIEELETENQRYSERGGDLLTSVFADLATRRIGVNSFWGFKPLLGSVFGKLSSLWQLLLWIDSMVLTGIIGIEEASNMRKIISNDKTGLVEMLTPFLQQGDSTLLAELRQQSAQAKRSRFHILHICAEMEPVTSEGPLAPYVTGLSQALQRKGNLVEVILPKYKTLNLSYVDGLREIPTDFYSYFNGQLHGNKIWTGVVGGIGVTFIEPVYYASFFNRERVYGYSDDFERFSYFSRAALDYIIKSGNHPDVLHIHNGETAIVGPLFWDIFVNQGLGATRILLTCQGFDSQYLEQPDKLGLCGLDPLRLHRHDRLQDNVQKHLVNILKGGVVYSNKVVVMSTIHSKEKIIQSQAQGLEPTLSSHMDKFLIAPNGFDHYSWDPSTDKFLPKNYSANDMTGKSACKAALQQRVGLSEDASAVLVSCILSKLSDVDLKNLMGVVPIASTSGIQVIIMEASKAPSIDSLLNSFQEELKGKEVVLINQYEEALSHLILGGSDIILCRSYDDPVLQIPLKAAKYGTAPISIASIEQRFRRSLDYKHGSTQFAQYINETFANMSLVQAFDEIKSRPEIWNKKIQDAMNKDFSWDAECCDMHISAYESIKTL